MSTDNEKQMTRGVMESVAFMSGRQIRPRNKCWACGMIGAVLGYATGLATLMFIIMSASGAVR